MTGLPCIRYNRPERYVRPTAWGRDWRLRWFRHVGSVHQHWQNHQLVAFYSNDRDPAVRLALQTELEAQPSGPAEVIAACREASRRHDRMVVEGNSRFHAQMNRSAQ